MDRRSFIGSTAVASLASLPLAAAAAEHNHGAHAHGKHAAAPSAPNLYAGALAAAGECITHAEVCLNHCLNLLGEGDQSMAACSKAVNQMLALCKSLQSLAAQRSPLTPLQAKICIEACKQCADACKEHIDHHAECKDCYESCLKCVEACEKIAVK